MDTVRSEWERSIEKYIRDEYPSLSIKTNDRTTIPSRENTGQNLEIDIWIPSLNLGIEANGYRYHDHSKYRADKRNGTEYSDEMYKENYCKKHGIELIHVWDTESKSTIHDKIDSAIEARRANAEATKPIAKKAEHPDNWWSKFYKNYIADNPITVGVTVLLIAIFLWHFFINVPNMEREEYHQQQVIERENREQEAKNQEYERNNEARKARATEAQRLRTEGLALVDEAIKLRDDGQEDAAAKKSMEADILFARADSLDY